MSLFVISQLLAICSLLIGITAFQLQQRKYILRGWSLALLFYAAHFALLHQSVAALFILINATRLYVGSCTTGRRWMVFFMSVVVLHFFISEKQPIHVLAFVAALLGTCGSFISRVMQMRMVMALVSLLWMVHNVIINSPAGFFSEMIYFSSNLIGMVRYLQHRTDQSAE